MLFDRNYTESSHLTPILAVPFIVIHSFTYTTNVIGFLLCARQFSKL